MDVEFDHLVKKFGQVLALNDFSLHVPDGNFLVMLGPSGCGKTTALRCLAGLEKPSAGLIRIGGKVVNHLPPRDRDIALVFQSYALYPQMTVGQNIMYPLRIRRVPLQERLRRAHEVAQRLAIDALFDRRPGQLSGGQRQRVALARAIIRNPNLFLMDEPLSNLDARLRVDMRAELKHLQKSLGTTTIYVTHDQAEAMTMADQIAIVRDGRLEQVGTPDEIYFAPNSVYVAGFVGSPTMNLVSVRHDSSAQVFAADGFSIPAAPIMGRYQVADSSGSYVLGIRPEHTFISFEEKPGAVKGVVYAVEPMGNETLVYVSAGRSTLVARADALVRAALDTPCWLEFRTDQLHLFDTQTEQRIPNRAGA